MRAAPSTAPPRPRRLCAPRGEREEDVRVAVAAGRGGGGVSPRCPRWLPPPERGNSSPVDAGRGKPRPRLVGGPVGTGQAGGRLDKGLGLTGDSTRSGEGR